MNLKPRYTVITQNLIPTAHSRGKTYAEPITITPETDSSA